MNPGTRCSSNDKSGYNRILNAYFDRSPLEYIDLQEAVLESSVAIAEAEEIVSFAEWAFGPCGLPALRVLAFGDFSHGSRYSGQQFLSACPGGGLMESPYELEFTTLGDMQCKEILEIGDRGGLQRTILGIT